MNSPEKSDPPNSPATGLSPGTIAGVQRDFRRCSPETIEAILRFKQRRDPDEIPVIGTGILRRHLPEHARPALDAAGAETPLASLGVDSLALLESVFDLQDALDIEIQNAELRDVETMGGMLALLERKVREPR